MGNVCNCVKGADSKSSKSGQPATEVELNGSKEEAVQKGSEEKAKASDGEPQAAETTEVELEITPIGSEANKTSEIKPTGTTSVQPPTSEEEEKKTQDIAETEEKASKESKKEPVEQEKISEESEHNEAVNSSANVEEREPETTTKEPSVNVNNTEAHISEDEKITVTSEEVSATDEKTGSADDAEVLSHNESKGATEEKITEPDEEVPSVVQAPIPQSDINIAIAKEEAKDEPSKIEKEDSSVKANQDEIVIQAMPEEDQLPMEVSSKPEVEVIQVPSGNTPDEKNSLEVSSDKNAFEADSRTAELKSNLTAGEDAEKLPSEINLSNEKEDSLNIGSSISAENDVLNEEFKESEKTPSVVPNNENTAESSQAEVTEEENRAVEDEEHNVSQSPEQHLDPQTTDDTTSDVVETNVDTLPEEPTLKQPKVELSDLQDTPLEVSQSNEAVPSNTPIHAAFLPLEKTANGKEPTLLDELGLGLADHPPESSLADKVQKYVEEMVANGVAAAQEELSKDDEAKSVEDECSPPPEEGMDQMVDASEKEEMMQEEASSDAQKSMKASAQEQSIEPGIVEEPAVTMEENQVLESIPLELRVEAEDIVKDEEPAALEETEKISKDRVEAEDIVKDEEPAALEETEKISNDLEQPVTIATIEESIEQQEDTQLVSNSPSTGDEAEDNQVATQTETKSPDQDEDAEVIPQVEAEAGIQSGAEAGIQSGAEVANKAKIDLSTEEEFNPIEAVEKLSSLTADQEELQKELPELELPAEKRDEQHEAIDILADSEVITSTSLHKDTANDVEEQGASTTEQSGDDSMVDSMLSLLEKKFPSSTLQEVETED